MFSLVPNSFGDIVAAVNLVWSIYSALRESKGAAEDYQCLVQELKVFHDALIFVNNVISDFQIPLKGVVTQRILEEVSLCVEFLRKFHASIEGYRKKLGGGKAGSPWYTSSWHKIGWTLFKKQDVADIRNKVSRHQQTIEFFLSGVGMYVIGVMRLDPFSFESLNDTRY